jgi:hypothetical protein
MSGTRVRWRLPRVVLAVLLLALYPTTGRPYEQAENLFAHQWITQQGWAYYRSQFGPSEVDAFLGEVRTYADGQNNRCIEGVYDEDMAGENPWGQSAPYANHFWWFDANNYSRIFDRGFPGVISGWYDSGANRAVKYFTGGNGLTGTFDTGWGSGQNAERDRGIVWLWRNDTGDNARKGRAYYWLGAAAHMLQDLTLPCHALNDAHILGSNQDPVHDWVDGRAFVQGNSTNNGAAFNDSTARRWERWGYQAASRSVGRPNGTVPLENGAIRSAAQLRDLVLQQEWLASVPDGAQAQSLPLYHLFLETAGLADDFDSRDVNGQVDGGNRRIRRGNYSDWTMVKVDSVADVIVPRAMKATAELFRYFYSLVDSTPAGVTVNGLSGDELEPTPLGMPSLLTATGTDAVSGVDLDGYRFVVEQRACCGWDTALVAGPALPEIGVDLEPGVYRVRACVENGAGITGCSAYGYLEVRGTVPVLVEAMRIERLPGAVRLAWRLAGEAVRSLSGIVVQRAPGALDPFEDLTTVVLAPALEMHFVDALADVSESVWYRLVLLGPAGAVTVHGPIPAGAADPAPRIQLDPPVHGESGGIWIRYQIGSPAEARLGVYDVRGRLVRALDQGYEAAGSHVRNWDRTDGTGRKVGRGVYLIRLVAGGLGASRKLVLAED